MRWALLLAAATAKSAAATHEQKRGLLPQRHGAGSGQNSSRHHIKSQPRGDRPRVADALDGEVDAIVIVEDGSTDNSYEAWRSALRAWQRKYRPGVHEIEPTTEAAIANADVFCFLQDDDIPNDRGWGTRVMSMSGVQLHDSRSCPASHGGASVRWARHGTPEGHEEPAVTRIHRRRGCPLRAGGMNQTRRRLDGVAVGSLSPLDSAMYPTHGPLRAGSPRRRARPFVSARTFGLTGRLRRESSS